jgi:hypothetical protein
MEVAEIACQGKGYIKCKCLKTKRKIGIFIFSVDLGVELWEGVVGDATAPGGGIRHYCDVLLHLSLQV